MKVFINKKLLWFSLILIILCKPVAISYSFLDKPFKILQILLFLYVIYELVIEGRIAYCSRTFYFLILYEIILLVSTLVNGTSLYHWVLYGMTFISVFYFVEKYIRMYSKKTLKYILGVFLLMLILNLCSAIFQMGIQTRGTTFYFLGLRTRVTDTVYVCLLALVLYLGQRKDRFYIFWGLVTILGSLIIFSVSTLYIGLAIFIILIVLYKKKTLRKLVANKFFICVVAAGIIGVVVFRIQENFNPIFALFGKGVDLNYRTYIWDSALLRIKESPLSLCIGHGITELGEWATFEGRRWQAHNQFLQITLDGGLAGLVCFCFLIFSSLRYCIANRNDRKMFFCIALMISYLIIMITEIYSYYPQFYIIISVMGNLKYFRADIANNRKREKQSGFYYNSNVQCGE